MVDAVMVSGRSGESRPSRTGEAGGDVGAWGVIVVGGGGAFGFRLPLKKVCRNRWDLDASPGGVGQNLLGRACCFVDGARCEELIEFKVHASGRLANAGLGLALPVFEGDRTITFFLNTLPFILVVTTFTFLFANNGSQSSLHSSRPVSSYSAVDTATQHCPVASQPDVGGMLPGIRSAGAEPKSLMKFRSGLEERRRRKREEQMGRGHL